MPCQIVQGLQTTVQGVQSPIRVAPKPKSCQKLCNVFNDDQGFPDQSDKSNHLMHNINGGVILHKKKYPEPSLDAVDPLFNYQFDEAFHADKIKSKLSISHLPPANAAAVVALITKYWTVFDDRSTFTPVWNYQCVIDTGIAALIAIKKINYGTW
jgi:hypothetical protein